MEVRFHANMCDQATRKIADALHQPLRDLGGALSRDYGGTMQHLWIDFELIRDHCELRPPYPFRFQKKVGGGICRLTGMRTTMYEHVGHYSVRPDFDVLLALPLDQVVSYVLSRIHESTSVLIEKQKKLGGLDAQRFREDFAAACKEMGHPF